MEVIYLKKISLELNFLIFIIRIFRNILIIKSLIFDLNWKHENLIRGFPDLNKIIEIPENLEEMISLARKRSSGFSFVRVDMYNIKEKIID